MKKLICIILSFMMLFSFLSISTVVSAAEIIYGDVNDDGVVDTKDYLMMKKRIAGLVNNLQINRLNTDINGDGKINVLDLNKLAKHLTNKEILGKTTYYAMDELSDSMNLVGRAVLDNDKVLLSQTASGIKFKANCNGDLIFYVTTAANGYMDIIVDDNYDNVTRVAVSSKKTKYQQELGLSEGEHIITLLKATEWSQNNLITLSAVSIFGEKANAKPASRPHRIEFYGDSLTSGYGNFNKEKGSIFYTWDCQDGGQTYATFLSNKLNAEWAIASASGFGVLGGHSDHTSLYSKFFDYSVVNSTDASKNIKWSRSNFDADLIIINYGTNDDTRAKKEGLDIDAFVAECGKIITAMRADNPDVKILWNIGMASISDSSDVVKALKTVASTYNIDFYKCPAKANGGDGHPTIEDHKYHAENLYNKINELYPDLFK